MMSRSLNIQNAKKVLYLKAYFEKVMTQLASQLFLLKAVSLLDTDIAIVIC